MSNKLRIREEILEFADGASNMLLLLAVMQIYLVVTQWFHCFPFLDKVWCKSLNTLQWLPAALEKQKYSLVSISSPFIRQDDLKGLC